MSTTEESSYVILSPADSTSPVPSANISYPAFFESNEAGTEEIKRPSINPRDVKSLPNTESEQVATGNVRCKSWENGDQVPISDDVNANEATQSQRTNSFALSFERIRTPSNEPAVSSSSSSSSSFSEACDNLVSENSGGDFYSEFEAVLRNLRIENESLRTVVDSNNAAMKRQLKIVQSWQEEVVNMRKAYAELKEESEERILQLKQEKEDLRNGVEPRPELRNRSISRTSIGSESSYFWDSNDITELRTKIERLQELEKSNIEKGTQLEEALAKLERANEKCELLNSEVNELRKQLFGNPNVIPADGAPDGLISVLRAQIRHCQQETVVESQAKMQAMDRITSLQKELEETRHEKFNLEQLLYMGPAVVDLKGASAPPLPYGPTDDVIADLNGGKHRHKHHHHKEPSSRKIRHLIKK